MLAIPAPASGEAEKSDKSSVEHPEPQKSAEQLAVEDMHRIALGI